MLATAGPDLLMRASAKRLSSCSTWSSRDALRQAETGVQKVAERALVRFVLVDVGDAQLRLPVERMCRTFEHLFLFGDRREHDLERRAAKVVPESARGNCIDRLLHPAADGAERFHPLLATDEPGVVNGFRVRLVAVDDRGQGRAGWARVIPRLVARGGKRRNGFRTFR